MKDDKRIHSFDPIIGPRPRCLVLGSMPGKASLDVGEYYAHPRNLFWPLMAELIGFSIELDYAERCHALMGAGIALWDVLQSCQRVSSLDSDIDPSTITINDIGSLLEQHKQIRLVAFNGALAEKQFYRHMKRAQFADRKLIRLPSTSPANAAISRQEKLHHWQRILSA